MPTYGYRCDNCGNEFDVRQSFHDEPKAACPRCQNIAQRLFHAPPVIYKGSGFYTTDYARKGGSSASSPSSSGGSPSSSSSSTSESSSSTTSDSGSKESSSKSDGASSKPSTTKSSD